MVSTLNILYFFVNTIFSISIDGTTISDSLNYVELVTISTTECEDYYGSILPEMVCANSPSSQVRSTCSVSVYIFNFKGCFLTYLLIVLG